MGPRAGLDRCGKSRPTGIRSPHRPPRSQSLYRLSYRAHIGIYRPTLMLSVSCKQVRSPIVVHSQSLGHRSATRGTAKAFIFHPKLKYREWKKKRQIFCFISYFYKRSGKFCVYLRSSYRYHPVKLSMAASVTFCVMYTNRGRVIWLSGPGYTTLYTLRLSTDDKERSKKIYRNIQHVYKSGYSNSVRKS